MPTRRGDRWLARVRLPDGRVLNKTFDRQRDAAHWENQQKVAIRSGGYVEGASGRMTFAAWHERWLPGHAVGLRPGTLARDASYTRTHILPVFGERPIAGITRTEVADWVLALQAKGLAPSTIEKIFQIFHKVIRAAHDEELIRRDPCRGVELPEVVISEMRFLTPAEIEKLAEAIDGRYRAFVTTAAYCGLRIGELAGLRRERVDLFTRKLTVAQVVTEVRGTINVGPPKTKAGRRVVSMPPAVASELRIHLAGHQSDWVFPAPDGGVLRTSLWRRRFWAPAVKRAGLEPLRPHDLRHTAVALWIAAGGSPKEIANRAGHTSVSVVLDRYGHLFPEQDERLMARLDLIAREKQL